MLASTSWWSLIWARCVGADEQKGRISIDRIAAFTWKATSRALDPVRLKSIMHGSQLLLCCNSDKLLKLCLVFWQCGHIASQRKSRRPISTACNRRLITSFFSVSHSETKGSNLILPSKSSSVWRIYNSSLSTRSSLNPIFLNWETWCSSLLFCSSVNRIWFCRKFFDFCSRA